MYAIRSYYEEWIRKKEQKLLLGSYKKKRGIKVLIKNAEVFMENRFVDTDIRIEEKKIVKIEQSIVAYEKEEVVDAKGRNNFV